MSITTTTHLNLDGTASEALDFYESIFGGDKMVFTYEAAQNVQDPSDAKKVMYGHVINEQGFRIMAYDVPAGVTMDPGEAPFYVSIRGDDKDEITKYWDGLSDGATVRQPLGEAPWSPLYGQLKDRFGVIWTLDFMAEQG